MTYNPKPQPPRPPVECHEEAVVLPKRVVDSKKKPAFVRTDHLFQRPFKHDPRLEELKVLLQVEQGLLSK